MRKIKGFLFTLGFVLYIQFFPSTGRLVKLLLMVLLRVDPAVRRKFINGGALQWALNQQWYLGFKVDYLNEEMQERIAQLPKCVLLQNHRSWTDWSLALTTTAPGRTLGVTRADVAALMAVSGFWSTWIERSTVVLSRSRRNREKIRAKLYRDLSRAQERKPFIFAFPEGHRNPWTNATLPLKHGMIKWAYENKLPTAIVLHEGNEVAFCEKTWAFTRGVTIQCLHKGIYLPEDFATYEEFFARIDEDFATGYAELVERRVRRPPAGVGHDRADPGRPGVTPWGGSGRNA